MNNKNQRKKFLDIIGDISFDGSQGYNQTFDPDTHVRIPGKYYYYYYYYHCYCCFIIIIILSYVIVIIKYYWRNFF